MKSRWVLKDLNRLRGHLNGDLVAVLYNFNSLIGNGDCGFCCHLDKHLFN